MAGELHDQTIAVLAAQGTSEAELLAICEALDEAGAQVLVASPGGEPVAVASQRGLGAATVAADVAIAELAGADLDAVCIPGGMQGADRLRADGEAVALLRRLLELGRPIAASGHGIWLLLEADALRGREVAALPSLRTDVRNGGGSVVAGREVVVDGHVVSAQRGDEPMFLTTLVQLLARPPVRAAPESAQAPPDRVDEASEESFPASDAPPGPAVV